MKIGQIKRLAALMALGMLLGLLIACTGQTDNKPAEQAAGNTDGKAAEQGEEPKGSESDGSTEAGPVYPLQSDAVMTYWAPLNANLNGLKSAYSEVPFYQELQKRTGVTLDFINPPVGQFDESFNVLLASGELPDMMEWDWRTFPGGPERAIRDGYILALNDLIDQHAPNLKKYLAEHPEADKQIKSDSGKYYAFPFFRGDDLLKVYNGPIIRQDWLDELGLPMPETIDDWYVTLTAFKEQKGSEAPLAMNPFFFSLGHFIGAWGVIQGFYLEEAEVKYGPIDSRYKEFLVTMRQWYEEGLIDQNFALLDGPALDAKMTTGVTGATVGNAGGGIGRWIGPLQQNEPDAKLVAAPYPVMVSGETPKFGQKDFTYSSAHAVAISAQSPHAELAVKFLDYGYSEEGHQLYNFGIENESYTLIDNEPVYTDLLMNNPEQLAPAQAISLYTHANHNGPFVQDRRYIEQFFALPEQKEAIAVWQTEAEKNMLPPISPTQEEGAELSSIMNDANTLVSEMSLKIIMGVEPLEAYDQMIAQLKAMKIDRAIEIQHTAYTRYLER